MNRLLRGIRDRMPGGYLAGRIDGGEGPVGIVSLRDVAVAVANIFSGGSATSASGALLPGPTNINNYLTTVVDNGFGFSTTQVFTDGEYIATAVFGFDILFPSAAYDSVGVADIVPTADAVFEFKVGGATVGTLTFLAGSTAGTVSWGAGYTLLAGTPLKVYTPNPADVTLAGVSAVVYGDKQ